MSARRCLLHSNSEVISDGARLELMHSSFRAPRCGTRAKWRAGGWGHLPRGAHPSRRRGATESCPGVQLEPRSVPPRPAFGDDSKHRSPWPAPRPGPAAPEMWDRSASAVTRAAARRAGKTRAPALRTRISTQAGASGSPHRRGGVAREVRDDVVYREPLLAMPQLVSDEPGRRREDEPGRPREQDSSEQPPSGRGRCHSEPGSLTYEAAKPRTQDGFIRDDVRFVHRRMGCARSEPRRREDARTAPRACRRSAARCGPTVLAGTGAAAVVFGGRR